MREIRFRAWDKKLNKMYPPISLKKLLSYLIFQDSPNSDAYMALKDHFEDIEWLEFIGLCDKNRNEYYADDIALSKDGLRKYVVAWNDKNGNWYLRGIGKAWNVNDPIWDDYEKIGSVHSDPDSTKTDEYDFPLTENHVDFGDST